MATVPVRTHRYFALVSFEGRVTHTPAGFVVAEAVVTTIIQAIESLAGFAVITVATDAVSIPTLSLEVAFLGTLLLVAGGA